MSEPAVPAIVEEIPAPAPEPVYEPWALAVDAVCSALETYAAWRLLSGDIAGCAHAAGITATTAARFERTLDALSENDATPGEATPEAADIPAPTQ